MAEQQHTWIAGVASTLGQMANVVGQPRDQRWLLSRDLVRIGPVAVRDRRSDDQPTLGVRDVRECRGERGPIATRAVQRDQDLQWLTVGYVLGRADVDVLDLGGASGAEREERWSLCGEGPGASGRKQGQHDDG